jgi:hypothetical protein
MSSLVDDSKSNKHAQDKVTKKIEEIKTDYTPMG